MTPEAWAMATLWLATGRVLAAVKRVRAYPASPSARAALREAWAWRRALQARGRA
jgi:hypothetical protein